ncbi:MAG: hypothetical protein ACYDGS_08965 [Thermoleophilia bacterium]
MKTLEIWQQVAGLYYELKLEDGKLVIESTDFSRDLPPGLISELKAHKSELLSLLRFQEEADRLLLESSRRIAQAWPQGFDLDDDLRWQQADRELHNVYLSMDGERLRVILELREKLALKLFETYRKERAA